MLFLVIRTLLSSSDELISSSSILRLGAGSGFTSDSLDVFLSASALLSAPALLSATASLLLLPSLLLRPAGTGLSSAKWAIDATAASKESNSMFVRFLFRALETINNVLREARSGYKSTDYA